MTKKHNTEPFATTPHDVVVNEAAYRRGFVQGMQFAVNSLREGATEQEIADARDWLHWEWRTKMVQSRRIEAPMSVKDLARFNVKAGLQ